MSTIRKALSAWVARHRNALAFLVAILLAIGPDLYAALDGQPLNLRTVGRALLAVLVAALLNGRLVPVVQRFYPKATEALEPSPPQQAQAIVDGALKP